jgi:Putative adhesin
MKHASRRSDETMASWEFPGTDPIDIIITIAAGSVAVSAEPTEVTTVSLEPSHGGRSDDRLVDDVQVTFAHGQLKIAQPNTSILRGHDGLDLKVTAPTGSRVTVRTASANVSCVGDLAELHAKTASGDVTAGSVSGPLEVTTASGDVRLEDAGASAELKTASGDIRLRSAAGDVTASTAAGDVSIGTAGASVRVDTASGDVRIGSAAAGETAVKTVSGDSRLGVAAGADVYLDLSSLTGRITNGLGEADGSDGVSLQVSCRSVSGDIQIVRADAASQ